MDRGCGLYLPISELYNKYGYGCFSKEAYDFIDYISNLKVKYWQIEPLNLFEDIYYKKSTSSFAGNPLYIDIEKYLTSEEIEFFKIDNSLSYEDYRLKKNEVLRYIFDKMYYSTNIDKFIENNEYWIYDYAVFMALKDELNVDYIDFPEQYKNIDSGETISFIKTHSEEIIYYIFIQYLFFKQWKELKKYASLRGIKIITTSDLLVSNDSSDLYANKRLFIINKNENNENNISFNFNNIKNEKYKYFIDRYKFNSSLYDLIIINYNESIDDKDFDSLANELLNNGVKNIIFDVNNYNIDGDGTKIINYSFKSKYLIKNTIDGFLHNQKDNLPNNYSKKVIGYLGFKNYRSLSYYLDNEIFFKKIANYLNLDVSTDKSTIIKMAIENIIISNADVCIIDIKDILFNDTFVENINFTNKLKKNYQEESLFLYLKELIKNKNR